MGSSSQEGAVPHFPASLPDRPRSPFTDSKTRHTGTESNRDRISISFSPTCFSVHKATANNTQCFLRTRQSRKTSQPLPRSLALTSSATAPQTPHPLSSPSWRRKLLERTRVVSTFLWYSPKHQTSHAINGPQERAGGQAYTNDGKGRTGSSGPTPTWADPPPDTQRAEGNSGGFWWLGELGSQPPA